MVNKWKLILAYGYWFEFENKDHANVVIKIFTTNGEKCAWEKLKKLVNEKSAK